ncbi:MAG: ATP synthase subunit C [Candidatus Methanomethylicaceae archaeon]
MNLKNIPAKKRVRLFWALVLTTSAVMISASVIVVTATASQITSEAPSTAPQDVAMLALSSALACGLCGIAAGYALAKSGSAAIAALAEKPETFFKAFLVVTLCEAVAIYGLVIAVLLWLRIPA